MIRRITLLTLTMTLIACGTPETPDGAGGQFATIKEAVIGHIDQCVGPLPNTYGMADLFAGTNYTGACLRAQGGVQLGSTSQGLLVTTGWPLRSVKLSTVNTTVMACKGLPNGPGYSPCNGDINTKVASTSGPVAQLPFLPWPAGGGGAAISFAPLPRKANCPYTLGQFPPPATYQECGDYSDSGLPRIVAHAVADTNPIVGNINTGEACTCPKGAVIARDSECVYRCF